MDRITEKKKKLRKIWKDLNACDNFKKCIFCPGLLYSFCEEKGKKT